MKKVTLILGVIVTITLMSCGNSSENKDANKITIEDENSGAKVTASVGEQKLPEDFPKDIYLMAGDKEHLTTVNVGKQKTVSFFQHSKLSSKEVREEIVKNMETNEWKTEMNAASQLYFSKEGNTVRIGIGKDDNNELSINYIVTY